MVPGNFDTPTRAQKLRIASGRRPAALKLLIDGLGQRFRTRRQKADGGLDARRVFGGQPVSKGKKDVVREALVEPLARRCGLVGRQGFDLGDRRLHALEVSLRHFRKLQVGFEVADEERQLALGRCGLAILQRLRAKIRRHRQRHHKHQRRRRGDRIAANLSPEPRRQAFAPADDRFAGEKSFQILGQREGGGIALRGILRQAFEADGLEIARDLRHELRRRRGIPTRCLAWCWSAPQPQ